MVFVILEKPNERSPTSFNMAEIITIPTFSDERGDLSVLQDILPYPIQRVFYIKGKTGKERGGKVHRQAYQCMISLYGSCNVEIVNKKERVIYNLNSSNKGLIVEPGDWHLMHDFSEDNILLVISTEKFNPEEISRIKPNNV